MKLKTIMKKCGMVCLLVGAIYTTLVSVSNVTITDVKAWVDQDETSVEKTNSDAASQNNVALEPKTLNKEKATTKHLSSEEIKGPKTLEEAVNIKQYPKQKVMATGYTAGVESTGKQANDPEYGVTYSGLKVKRDLYSTIAADLDIYPIGTILFIPGYGYGVVADKGGAVNGQHIDLYYPTVEDVYEKWGKKELNVYVVKKGDGSLSKKEFKKLNENKALQVFREEINKS